jgi:sulfur carrier protein
MNIIFNNQTRPVKEHTSIQLVLKDFLGDAQKGIAVAVNETVVPKGQWENYELKDNDKVLVIRATQGG